MSAIEQLDWSVFYWINAYTANQFFDVLMPWLRNKYFWLPLYVFVISFFVINWGKRGVVITAYLLMLFVLTDSTNSRIVKHFFERIRPCHEPALTETVILRVNCPGGYSFPSSHAVNHAGIGAFLFLLFGRLKKRWHYLWVLWPVSIAYAQIYVGVHYPADVFAGLLLGGSIGTAIYFLFRSTERRLFKESFI